MNRMLPKATVLAATAVLLAGCSTAPTVTVPNPLSVFNGVFPSPVAASAPVYTTQPIVSASTPTYSVTQPSIVGSTYGVAPPTYGTLTPSYSASVPSYSTGTSYGQLQPVQVTPSQVSIPSFGTSPTNYTASVPSYSAGAPYGQLLPAQAAPVQVNAPSFGTSPTNYTASIPSYSTDASYGQLLSAQPASAQVNVPTFGSVQQPIQNVANAYNAGVQPLPMTNPVSMGGSFQTLPSTPSIANGVATYQSAPTAVGLPSTNVLSY